MPSEETPAEKAIKKSAEGVAAPPSRKSAPLLTRDDQRYHQCIEAIDEAGLLPSDWSQVNMYDYPDRADVLVNFYTKDPKQDPTDLIDRHVIRSARVIFTESAIYAEGT